MTAGCAKIFAGLRAFCAAGFVALNATSAPAVAASDKVYTISNFPVEARDKSAVAAKERALAEGQQAALKSLLKRLVPVTSYARLAKATLPDASALVSGVSVRSERTSSVEYLANLDFAFQPEAVRHALTEQSLVFVEDQAPPTLVIPVSRDGDGAPFKSDSGTWTSAWRSLDLEHTLTPVRIGALRPTISGDLIDKLLKGDDEAFRVIAGEYKTDAVLIAAVNRDTAAKRVVVTLAGRDATGSMLLQRGYRVSDGDYDYAIELGSVVALGVIEGRWKQLKAGGVGTGGTVGDLVSLQAEFSSLEQWNDIRRLILETPGVENLDIGAVSSRDAMLSMTYAGGAEALAAALRAQGLQLNRGGPGWIVTAGY